MTYTVEIACDPGCLCYADMKMGEDRVLMCSQCHVTMPLSGDVDDPMPYVEGGPVEWVTAWRKQKGDVRGRTQ